MGDVLPTSAGEEQVLRQRLPDPGYTLAFQIKKGANYFFTRLQPLNNRPGPHGEDLDLE